ncbi:unnamed protein product [Closterium sp. NIES-54]
MPFARTHSTNTLTRSSSPISPILSPTTSLHTPALPVSSLPPLPNPICLSFPITLVCVPNPFLSCTLPSFSRSSPSSLSPSPFVSSLPPSSCSSPPWDETVVASRSAAAADVAVADWGLQAEARRSEAANRMLRLLARNRSSEWDGPTWARTDSRQACKRGMAWDAGLEGKMHIRGGMEMGGMHMTGVQE